MNCWEEIGNLIECLYRISGIKIKKDQWLTTLMNKIFLLIALMLAGCVNADPQTGKTIPRGNQKYKFATVERRAEELKDGMTRLEVHMLLGTPAEISDDTDVWVYLPERPAVLVPSRALRLVFKGDVLVSHGYSAIVLGKQL
jgi:outer membrane protein assembly factor BamE (lipoprotein component of BamABCDE complex)